MHSLPVDRLTRMTLNYWRYMARSCYYLCGPIMNVMLMLSNLDTRTWLTLVQPEFENSFFVCAVEFANEPTRESAWIGLEHAFAAACSQAYAVVNGNGSELQSDSDTENKMDVDQEPGERVVVTYLWTLTINCLKRSSQYWGFAGKAFESAVNMFRYHHP